MEIIKLDMDIEEIEYLEHQIANILSTWPNMPKIDKSMLINLYEKFIDVEQQYYNA